MSTILYVLNSHGCQIHPEDLQEVPAGGVITFDVAAGAVCNLNLGQGNYYCNNGPRAETNGGERLQAAFRYPNHQVWGNNLAGADAVAGMMSGVKCCENNQVIANIDRLQNPTTLKVCIDMVVSYQDANYRGHPWVLYVSICRGRCVGGQGGGRRMTRKTKRKKTKRRKKKGRRKKRYLKKRRRRKTRRKR